MPFGGMLGSTFNFVFENQLEKLQDGDRFYYLERTAGLNFNAELEGNSFAKLIMANTDVDPSAWRWSSRRRPSRSRSIRRSSSTRTWSCPARWHSARRRHLRTRADPVNDGPFATCIPLVIRDNPDTVGPDTNYLAVHGPDRRTRRSCSAAPPAMTSSSPATGDDTLYGDDGNDQHRRRLRQRPAPRRRRRRHHHRPGGDDNIQGRRRQRRHPGRQRCQPDPRRLRQDFIITGEDASEAFGGQGNDFILGSKANEQDIGNEGDDWIEKGTSRRRAGDNFDPLGNDPIIGNDVFIGDGENDKFNRRRRRRHHGRQRRRWRPLSSAAPASTGPTFKDDPIGVTIDLDSSVRFFDQPQVPGSGVVDPVPVRHRRRSVRIAPRRLPVRR